MPKPSGLAGGGPAGWCRGPQGLAWLACSSEARGKAGCAPSPAASAGRFPCSLPQAPHKVNLNAPQKTILVNLVKGTCGVAVVQRFRCAAPSRRWPCASLSWRGFNSTVCRPCWARSNLTVVSQIQKIRCIPTHPCRELFRYNIRTLAQPEEEREREINASRAANRAQPGGSGGAGGKAEQQEQAAESKEEEQQKGGEAAEGEQAAAATAADAS